MHRLLLIVIVAAGLQAAESGSATSAALEAAKHARPAQARAAAPSVRIQAAPSFGTIRIGSVTRVTAAGPVPRYSRFECAVVFERMTGSHYYDPNPSRGGVDLRATFTSPEGAVWSIPGYYDGSTWRIRFAPDTEGAWTYQVTGVDSSGTNTWTGGTFTCTGTTGHGWVRITDRWYRHADGTPFSPVGHNTGWQDDVEQPAFADLAADAPAGSAPRLVSFWLSQPWTIGAQSRALIEQIDLGEWIYEPTACTYIDGVVDRAEAAGVFLLPSIWIHDQLRDAAHEWSGVGDWGLLVNPYNDLDPDPITFFDRGTPETPSEQWIRQQAFCRYLTARWGSSQAIAGWVGVAELNGSNGGQFAQPQAIAWTAALDDWFVANDPYRSSGGRHPIAFSVTDGSPVLALDGDQALSQRAIDSYAEQFDDTGVAELIADEVLAMQTTPRKPVLVTEFGGDINVLAPPAATQPLHMHNGMWASWIAGAAMPALLWCDGVDFPMLDQDMRDHQAHQAVFIGRLSWVCDADQVAQSVTVDGRTADVQGWVRQLGDRGALWLHRFAGTADLQGSTVTVSATNGRYARWWFDTWTGAESSATNVEVTDETLSLVAPISDNPDVAVSWQRYPVADGLSTTAGRNGRLRLTLAPSAPKILITGLPGQGRIWQAVDATTPGAEITTVPTVVSDAQHRIFYDAPDALGTVTIGYAIEEGRLQGGADITIQIVEAVVDGGGGGDGDGNQVETVPSHGCGAGGVAGLGLIALVGLRRRRR